MQIDYLEVERIKRLIDKNLVRVQLPEVEPQCYTAEAFTAWASRCPVESLNAEIVLLSPEQAAEEFEFEQIITEECLNAKA